MRSTKEAEWHVMTVNIQIQLFDEIYSEIVSWMHFCEKVLKRNRYVIKICFHDGHPDKLTFQWFTVFYSWYSLCWYLVSASGFSLRRGGDLNCLRVGREIPQPRLHVSNMTNRKGSCRFTRHDMWQQLCHYWIEDVTS